MGPEARGGDCFAKIITHTPAEKDQDHILPSIQRESHNRPRSVVKAASMSRVERPSISVEMPDDL